MTRSPRPLPSPPAPAALLFDLDGTLVDSRRDIAAACNATRTAYGLAPLPFDAIMPMVGDGARLLVARAFDRDAADPFVDDALATLEAAYLARPCVDTVLLPGARAVLELGAAARLPCALVTNKSRAVTLLVLDALEITPYFQAIWGGGDGPLKPSRAGVDAMTARLGVDARAAWMIGDGPQDVGAGKAAGCFTVGVPGIAERRRLVDSGPDLVCESLDELRAALEQVLGAGLTGRPA